MHNASYKDSNGHPLRMPTSVTVVYRVAPALSYLLGKNFLTQVPTLFKERGVMPLERVSSLRPRGQQGAWSCLLCGLLRCIQVLSVTPVSRKEERWVSELLSNRSFVWLIEINLKWHCGARHFTMTIFIYLTVLHASCVKRLSWETTLFYWLLF